MQSLSSKDIRYTRNKAGTVVYAIALGWPEGEMQLSSFGTAAPAKPGRVEHVELLGTDLRPTWRQTDTALYVTLPAYHPEIDYSPAPKIFMRT